MAEVRLLATYLNDHLTGAYGGAAFAQRIARSHRGAESSRLVQLARDVSDDRDTLVAIMEGLGIRPARGRRPLAQAAEFLGRLKPNGSWTSRTPVTDLFELEMMSLAVRGKRAGWQTLRLLADDDRRLDRAQLDGLLDRAAQQADLLDTLRDGAARRLSASA